MFKQSVIQRQYHIFEPRVVTSNMSSMKLYNYIIENAATKDT